MVEENARALPKFSYNKWLNEQFTCQTIDNFAIDIDHNWTLEYYEGPHLRCWEGIACIALYEHIFDSLLEVNLKEYLENTFNIKFRSYKDIRIKCKDEYIYDSIEFFIDSLFSVKYIIDDVLSEKFQKIYQQVAGKLKYYGLTDIKILMIFDKLYICSYSVSNRGPDLLFPRYTPDKNFDVNNFIKVLDTYNDSTRYKDAIIEIIKNTFLDNFDIFTDHIENRAVVNIQNAEKLWIDSNYNCLPTLDDNEVNNFMNSKIVSVINDQLAEFINSDIKRLQTLPNVPDKAKNYIKFLFQLNILDKPSHYLNFNTIF